MNFFKSLIRLWAASPLSLGPGVGLSLLMLCFSGCGECPCVPWETAICQDTAGYDGLMYGDCPLEVNDVIVSVTYTCSSNSALGSVRESEIACYDPATNVDDWRDPGWGLACRNHHPRNRLAAGIAREVGRTVPMHWVGWAR